MTSTNVGQRRRARRAFLAATTILAAAQSVPAIAQLAPPAPVRQSVDKNGVNLFDGKLFVDGPAISLGSGQQGLSFNKLNRGSGWTDNVSASIDGSGSTMYVALGGTTDTFTVSGTSYINTEGNGATLTFASNVYTYTRSDGTVVRFSKTYAASFASEGRVIDITSPSGAKLTYAYEAALYCKTYKVSGAGYLCTQEANAYRPASVRNSYGYQLAFNYSSSWEYNPEAPTSQPDPAWYTITGVSASNLASANPTVRSQTYGDVSSGGFSYFQVTDPMNRVTKYRYGTGGLVGVTLPGSTAEDMTITYANGRVSQIQTHAGVTSYSVAADDGVIRTINVDGPMPNDTVVYKFDVASQRMKEVTNANGNKTLADYDASGRVTRVTQPEGNYVEVQYDTRGNVTQRKQVAKPNSGLADIIETAHYDDCTGSNFRICNRPVWTRDARGSQTDYTYDPNHGGVMTVTAPAPGAGPYATVRPQVRYAYEAKQAYFRNGSGSIVASGEQVTMLTGMSQCQTTASCVGTADEVKATIDYGPQTAGTGNNLLPVKTSQGAGDNSLKAETGYTYDDVGNLTYVDGPLSGNADTERALYNANRQRTGTISADPDGASGSLANRAQRTTYAPSGLVTQVEIGVTSGQDDNAWGSFATAQSVNYGYDARRRPITASSNSGGTIYSLTQTSYNADDSVDCVAQRMNPSAFTSLPTSACTLGSQGADGPDRISKAVYDNSGQLLQVQVGVGTADAATERTLTYSPNGTLQTLKDAEDNLTTFEYDGFDRLSKTRYPVSANRANQSSTTDFEQYTYDVKSNVTLFQARSGVGIGFGYDYLDRRISMGSSQLADLSYSYDLAGRMLTAKFATGGQGVTNTFDALGRVTSSTTDVGGTARPLFYQYDLAGRRTRLTFWDNNYFVYDRLITGEIDKVRANGASDGAGVLVRYGYDDLRRRRTANQSNATVTTWNYDAVSRLSSLSHDLTDVNGDVTISFGDQTNPGYNAANQIIRQTRSNDAYASTIAGLGSTNTPANGLNQLASRDGVAATQDANGNLAYDPETGFTYAYDLANRLTSATSGGTTKTLSYDPLSRLDTYNPGSPVRFIYDGVEAVAELDSSGKIMRRYIRGDGPDELLVEYVGTGSSDMSEWRFHHLDERGTSLSRSDQAGNLAGVNSYDEFGKPKATNWGRFQYTGQMWLPEIGLYHYKARAYDPGLGRFIEPDPIGYEGGVNLYAYVLGDPVNFVDRNGLDPLSLANARAATAMFGRGFNSSWVNIQFYSPYTFGRAALTAFNTINVAGGTISPALLLHELTHVWQSQSGAYSVFELFLTQMNDQFGADVYDYEIGPDSAFLAYNSEAQAQIVEDCVRSNDSNSDPCRVIRDWRRSRGAGGGGSSSSGDGSARMTFRLSTADILRMIEGQEAQGTIDGYIVSGSYYPPE